MPFSEKFIQIEEPIQRVEKEFSEEQKKLFDKARRFCRYPYPLTSTGGQLREKVVLFVEEKNIDELKKIESSIPTVESVHEELFRDIEIEEETAETIFGSELANVQISKGCRHGCDFCAAGAEKKIDMMPFVAVYKIGKAIEEHGHIDERKKAAASIEKRIKESTGKNIYDPGFSLFREFENVKTIYLEEGEHIFGMLPSGPSYSEERGLSSKRNIFLWIKNQVESLGFRQLTNFYDSDPFDYQDRGLLHNDGTPAHFGDVVRILSKHRSIHITTAGWVPQNRVAQKAAEEIVLLYNEDPRVLDRPRISINPTHREARKDPKKYFEMMKNVISTLAPIKPEILFIYNKQTVPAEFLQEVIDPLKALVAQQGLSEKHTLVSNFSGDAAQNDSIIANSDHDVMACMPGFHIWPDGSVLYQEPSDDGLFGVAKGNRPSPKGVRLY